MSILVDEADTLLDTLLDGTSDRTHQVLLWVYILPIFVLYVYNYARILNLYRAIVGTSFFTDIPLNKGGTIRPGEEPIVTVQICTFNEGEVVSETIESACMLDWPKDKLYVDICDDSNDPRSLDVIKHAVRRWSLSGINITHRTREKRHGYKAGCLADHFHTLKGDFVAHFDADHRMEADFLKCVMPHFFNKLGCHKEDVGCVQAPWGYYNIHQNMLTEADTLAMDIHHAIEQTGRSEALKVFSFNGTGGVWRKSAISVGGGWSPATVTEDLALSYNSFINGYNFVYVRDIPQLMESPACMQAHVQQKHRWTKGFFQVFRMEIMNILRCKHASWWVKFEAFIHMTAPIQFTCLAILTIFYPILAWHHIDSDLVRLVSVLPHTGPIAEAIVTIYAKAKGSDAEYGSFWSRTSRLAYIPHHIALKSGMMLFETMALIDGLTSNDATFLATPKEGAATKHGKSTPKKKSANGVHKKSANEYIAFFGLFLASYRLCFVYFVDLRHEIKSYAHVWFHLMNMCVVTGLFWVHGGWLLVDYKKSMHGFYSRLICFQQKASRRVSSMSTNFISTRFSPKRSSVFLGHMARVCMLSGLLVVQTIFVMDHQMEVVQNGLSLGNSGLHEGHPGTQIKGIQDDNEKPVSLSAYRDFGEPQDYFGPISSSAKLVAPNQKDGCTCEMEDCETCHRAIFSEHKMGHVLSKKVHDKFFPETMYLRGHWEEEVKHPPAHYRHVLITRNFYDSILSGYLYHKRGSECFDEHSGKPLENEWIYAWDKEVRESTQRSDLKWPSSRGRCICQYLAEESEEDGLRVFVEWAYRTWYAPLISQAIEKRSRELDAGVQMTLHLCMEDVNSDSYRQLIQDMDRFLYPYKEPIALESIEYVRKATAHATTKDEALRNRLRSMIADYDHELFGGRIAFHSNEFGCGQLD